MGEATALLPQDDFVGSHVARHIDLVRPASCGLSHDDVTKISLRPVSFSSAAVRLPRAA